MPFELQKSDTEWCLTLSGVVDIFDAATLHATALDAAEAPSRGLVVKLGDVEALDTSAMQLLLALARALRAADKTIRFEGAPAAVRERWQLAGLAEALG